MQTKASKLLNRIIENRRACEKHQLDKIANLLSLIDSSSENIIDLSNAITKKITADELIDNDVISESLSLVDYIPRRKK